MPIRYIIIPDPVVFRHPVTKDRVLKPGSDQPADPIHFASFLGTLMTHPKWDKGWKKVKAAIAITDALDAALAGDGVMTLDESNWKDLEECAVNPRSSITLSDGRKQESAGYAYPTRMCPQLAPFIMAIVDAKTTAPEAKVSIVNGEASSPPPELPSEN